MNKIIYERLTLLYTAGTVSKAQLGIAVVKELISAEQYAEIVGEE
jgi:hypothetical protein